MNIVVLQGALSSAPQVRELASGSLMVSLEVTTRTADGAVASAPIAWFDPPEVPAFVPGDEVVVVGVVRRRFFRTAAGATQSRTEVVATEVMATAQRRKVRRTLRAAVAALGGDDLGPVPGKRLRSQP